MVDRVGAGKDLMTILRELPCCSASRWPMADRVPVKANMAASEEDKLADQELIAQMS